MNCAPEYWISKIILNPNPDPQKSICLCFKQTRSRSRPFLILNPNPFNQSKNGQKGEPVKRAILITV
jgi:hypothetical protein